VDTKTLLVRSGPSINLIKIFAALMVSTQKCIKSFVCFGASPFEIYLASKLRTPYLCGYSSFSDFAFAFTFLNRRGVFALIDVIVTSRDAGALGVTKPRILVGTIPAGLHVAGVGDVACLEREGAFVAGVARLLSSCRLLAAIPCVECVQLFVFLRVGDPLKRLSCRHEPHIGPEKD
jgi:hypothetical protein